ncbi:HalOD1 output domain-containing protein [Natronococcus roseus]|uniref:HalOD1 output domain-containing protein n=1 Tax=Natronococcus roseus TaxID=1052014 RepID=UPI00374DD59E
MPSTSDPSDRRYEATFDPAGDSASEAVLDAVGTAADVDPLELEPLYAVIDPDAIDSLCAHARRTAGNRTHSLRFSYAGFDVDVRTDGRICVSDPSSTGAFAGGD